MEKSCRKEPLESGYEVKNEQNEKVKKSKTKIVLNGLKAFGFKALDIILHPFANLKEFTIILFKLAFKLVKKVFFLLIFVVMHPKKAWSNIKKFSSNIMKKVKKEKVVTNNKSNNKQKSTNKKQEKESNEERQKQVENKNNKVSLAELAGKELVKEKAPIGLDKLEGEELVKSKNVYHRPTLEDTTYRLKKDQLVDSILEIAPPKVNKGSILLYKNPEDMFKVDKKDNDCEKIDETNKIQGEKNSEDVDVKENEEQNNSEKKLNKSESEKEICSQAEESGLNNLDGEELIKPENIYHRPTLGDTTYRLKKDQLVDSILEIVPPKVKKGSIVLYRNPEDMFKGEKGNKDYTKLK